MELNPKIKNKFQRNLIFNYLNSLSDSSEIIKEYIKDNQILYNEEIYIKSRLNQYIFNEKYEEAYDFISKHCKSKLNSKESLSNHEKEVYFLVKFMFFSEKLKKNKENQEKSTQNLIKTINETVINWESQVKSVLRNDFLELIFSDESKFLLLINNKKQTLKSLLSYDVVNLENILQIYEDSHMNSKRKLKIDFKFTIDVHDEEVNNILISPCSKFFISVSKTKHIACYSIDNTSSIIEIDRNSNEISRIFNENSSSKTGIFIKLLSFNSYHSSEITHSDWKSDSSSILSCGKDKTIRIINPFIGKVLQTLKSHSDTVSSAIYIENKIVSSSLDKSILIWEKNEIGYFVKKTIISDIVNSMSYISKENLLILHSASINSLIVYCCLSFNLLKVIEFPGTIISFSVSDSKHSQDSQHGQHSQLIINYSKTSPVIDLYQISYDKINENIDFNLVSKCFGHRQRNYNVKCSFNFNSKMIMCGCENGYFYIWNRRQSLPLISMRHHSGTVNSVRSFLFEGEEYLVSASDDHRVNLYKVNYEE